MKNIERIVLLVIVVLSSISMRAQTLENFFKALLYVHDRVLTGCG